LDGREILRAVRLCRPSSSPASIAPEATGHGRDEDADGEAAMRTERQEPWGFDLWDPRLTLRQQAADAQRMSDADVLEVDQPAALDETDPADALVLETVRGGSAR
jgi:hypothetical protein